MEKYKQNILDSIILSILVVIHLIVNFMIPTIFFNEQDYTYIYFMYIVHLLSYLQFQIITIVLLIRYIVKVCNNILDNLEE